MKFLIIFIMFVTVSCATKVVTTSKFNEKEIAWSKETGKFVISGDAFAMTNGGTAKTCAGSSVYLIPKSDYAKDIMMGAYGNEKEGRLTGAGYKVENIDKNYISTKKAARCNAKGEYIFSDIAKGDYYIESFISWWAGGDAGTQKVYLMKGVSVKAKDLKNITLSL